MMLFVTITCQSCVLLDNYVASTVSSYEVLVFCASLLLNQSCYKWFQLFPGGSSSFQEVPTCSLFQYIRIGFKIQIFGYNLVWKQGQVQTCHIRIFRQLSFYLMEDCKGYKKKAFSIVLGKFQELCLQNCTTHCELLGNQGLAG